MENVEDQFDDDWLAGARRRHGRVHHRNQLLVEVVHAVVGQPSAATAHLVTHLHRTNVK